MKMFLILACAVGLLMSATACKSHSGSREFTPGKGWQQN